MSTCRQLRENMYALLAGEAAGLPEDRAWQHLERCHLCQEEWQAARSLWNGLDQFEMLEVPEELHQKTLDAVRSEAKREAESATFVLARLGGLTLARLAFAVLGGIAIALLFIFLLHQKIEVQPLSSNQLITLGTLWSGVLIAGLSWALGRFRLKNIQLSAPIWLALLGTTLVMIGTYYCPGATAYEWWSNSSIGVATKDALGPILSCCVFGMLYVLPAALLLAPILGRRFTPPLLPASLISAGLFTAMLLPAIYIQCADLAAGMMLSWVAGSLFGAASGIFGALIVARSIRAT